MTSVAPRALSAPTLDEIRAARARVADIALRTPLVKLQVESSAEIWLKLENLQPIGSFKLRGATNAMRLLSPDRLRRGVYTASAGNMAQGVAWTARLLGVSCDVVVPEHAPQTKLAAIERLGGRTTKLPFDEWWRVLVEHVHEPFKDAAFIHPVSDPAVIAGNGTIGLEILEDLPDVDTIVVPYGGGGLSSGVAAAVRSLRPDVKVYAAEVDTAAPLAASLAAGRPLSDVSYTASFVDGIGGRSVLTEMWPLVSSLLAGSLVTPIAAVAAAVRLLAERARVIAEGAGAAAVAAALDGRAGKGRIVCIVSGGNIDLAKLAVILQGGVP